MGQKKLIQSVFVWAYRGTGVRVGMLLEEASLGCFCKILRLENILKND